MSPFLSCVSAGCRLDEKSVRIFWRDLQQKGLVSTGARGVNAPDMTPRDLAVMILALLATDRPSKAAECVTYFGAMQLAHPDMWRSGGALPSNPDHTLIEIIETICDPAVELPPSVWIETDCQMSVTVGNDMLQHTLKDGERAPMSFLYHDRAAMQRMVDGKLEGQESERMTFHGIQIDRRIGAASLEAMKAVIFADHPAYAVSERQSA